MEARYLRQIGTNKPPFPYTDALAARRDMVPYNPAEAKVRIEANRRLIQSMKEGRKIDPQARAEAKAQAQEFINTAKELSATEQEIEAMKFSIEEVQKDTDSPVAKSKREQQMENDRELGEIREMTKKAQIMDYMERKYGKQYSDDELSGMSLKTFKDIAIKARIGTLFEVPDEKLK